MSSPKTGCAICGNGTGALRWVELCRECVDYHEAREATETDLTRGARGAALAARWQALWPPPRPPVEPEARKPATTATTATTQPQTLDCVCGHPKHAHAFGGGMCHPRRASCMCMQFRETARVGKEALDDWGALSELLTGAKAEAKVTIRVELGPGHVRVRETTAELMRHHLMRKP